MVLLGGEGLEVGLLVGAGLLVGEGLVVVLENEDCGGGGLLVADDLVVVLENEDGCLVDGGLGTAGTGRRVADGFLDGTLGNLLPNPSFVFTELVPKLVFPRLVFWLLC